MIKNEIPGVYQSGKGKTLLLELSVLSLYHLVYLYVHEVWFIVILHPSMLADSSFSLVQSWILQLVFGVIRNLLLLVPEQADIVLMQLAEMLQLS